MSTAVIKFSDATVRRFAECDAVTQLRDPRYALRFRYGKGRTTGSWHLYKCHRGRELWRKIGNWPGLKCKDVIGNLSVFEAQLASELESATLGQKFSTLG
ncbi:MAG: hypothetical protein LPH21_07400, partial [Shewanella sp.]|nr:hypothetical protein [Shewanella sp.]